MPPQSTNDLPPKHLMLIGLIATEWSLLEAIMERALWGLIGVTQSSGRPVTTYIHATTQCDLIITLSKGRYDETLIQQLDDLRKELKCLSGMRNNYVHAHWEEVGGSPMAGWGTINKRGEMVARTLEVDRSELEQVILRIQKLNEDFNNLFKTYRFPEPDP